MCVKENPGNVSGISFNQSRGDANRSPCIAGRSHSVFILKDAGGFKAIGDKPAEISGTDKGSMAVLIVISRECTLFGSHFSLSSDPESETGQSGIGWDVLMTSAGLKFN